MNGAAQGRPGRRERAARAALGMPARHPEQVTRQPGRAERKLLAWWSAEMWPREEYAEIIVEAWRENSP